MSSVLITGAGSGIGLATAGRFRAGGWSVAGVDLSFSPEAREKIGGPCIQGDVASLDLARRALDSAARELGGLDAVVACAGISRDATLSKMTPADWDRVLEVDFKGTYNYLTVALSILRRRGRGSLVAIASTVALRARRGLSNYVSAKAGVIGLVQALARDARRDGITVNAVAPGLVQTALARDIPAQVRSRLQEETCLGRLAEPEDVAHVVHFLCGPLARCLTGQVLRVDGGQLT